MLQKHNVGAGTPAGIQALALSLRASFDNKSGFATIDAANAFNTVHRPKALAGYIDTCPGQAHIMANLMAPSIALFAYIDEEGRQIREAIPVTTGARQGCARGADTFCTAVA